MVVDMQTDFVSSNKKNIKGSRGRLVHRQVRLLKWAKENDYPILLFEFAGKGRTINGLASVLHDVRFGRLILVPKAGRDGFDQECALEARPQSILRMWGVTKVVVTGVNATRCVSATVKSAMKHGFDVWTARDLIADFHIPSGYVNYPYEGQLGRSAKIGPGKLKIHPDLNIMLARCERLLR